VSLSVPRLRVEEVIRGFIEDDLLETGRLLEIGERYRAVAQSAAVVDYGPRIAQLAQERNNLIAAIKAGGLAAELGTERKAITAEMARLQAERPRTLPAPRALSEESIERRRAELVRKIAEGGPVARQALREIFPRAIQLQPDESGQHLWALFVYDEGATRINLLYESEEERIAAETAATLAAFQANAERVGNNGSGGARSLIPTYRRLSLAA
jgi:hypothetical protein